MAQVSLYIDDETMEGLRKEAKKAGMSLSKFTASKLTSNPDDHGWPDGWFDRVYGCLSGDEGLVVPSDLPWSPDDDVPELMA